MIIAYVITAIVIVICTYHGLSSTHWPTATTSSWNEQLFKGKNREYGAYRIRKSYNRTILLLLFTLTGTTLMLLLPWLIRSEITIRQMDRMHHIPISNPENFTLTENKKCIGLKGQNGQRIKPKITKSNTVSFANVELKLTIDTLASKGENQSGQIVGTSGLLPVLKKRNFQQVSFDENGVPDSITYPPQFIGGSSKLFEFVSDHVQLRPKGHGIVDVKFLIDKYGYIKKVWVEKKSNDCPQCDNAAIEVVEKMPRWEPARMNNTPVNSYHQLRINFR